MQGCIQRKTKSIWKHQKARSPGNARLQPVFGAPCALKRFVQLLWISVYFALWVRFPATTILELYFGGAAAPALESSMSCQKADFYLSPGHSVS